MCYIYVFDDDYNDNENQSLDFKTSRSCQVRRKMSWIIKCRETPPVPSHFKSMPTA